MPRPWAHHAGHPERRRVLKEMFRWGVRSLALVAVLSCHCAPAPEENEPVARLIEDLPPVSRPSPEAVQFDWPWCDVQVPPLADCGEWGAVSDVGASVSPEYVCLLTGGLKKRLTNGEWSSLPELRVCRGTAPQQSPGPPPTASLGRSVWHTWLRGRLPKETEVWAILDEDSGRIVYDVGGVGEEEFVVLPNKPANK